MKRCANTEALRRYELEQEKAEHKYEEFIEALRTEVLPLYLEARTAYDMVLNRYYYDNTSFSFCDEMESF